MRSKAHISSHPIHPMLIPFPISFLAGGMVADVIGSAFQFPAWSTAASYLIIAGIITALLAAAPGAVDYFYTVPPKSSAGRRATYHALVNLTTVGLFIAALADKGWPPVYTPNLALILEIIGTGLLGIGGWLGATLVERNFIGVEHRYAGSGKWQEQTVERQQTFTESGAIVAQADELKTDQMKLIRLDDGTRIALARTQDGWYAFQDHCTHRGGSLADGVLICGTVQCLWHGSQFDVKTGQVRSGPAKDPIKTFRVQEKDGQVRLFLEKS